MGTITLSDGTVVELEKTPLSNKNSWDGFSETAKNIAGFAGESARKAVASGMQAWDSMADTLKGSNQVGGKDEAKRIPYEFGVQKGETANPLTTQLPNMGPLGIGMSMFRRHTGGDKPVKETIKQIDVPSDGSYWDAAVRGIGGAAALPVPGLGTGGRFGQAVTSTGRNLLPGAAGGMTGKATGDFAGGINPSLQPYGELLGALFGGGLTGFALAPTQTPAQKDVRKALRPQTDNNGAGFDIARANSALADRVGSTTHTAAEAFPNNSALVSLGEQARGANFENDMRTRTEGREGDLLNLGQTFLDRIHPEVDSNIVANRVGGAATETILNAKAARDANIGQAFQGQTVRPGQVHGIAQDLMMLSLQPNRPGVGEALNEVARALFDQYGQPLTSLQQISLALAEMKNAFKNPMNSYAGRGIGERDMLDAVRIAEEQLGIISPVFAQAKTDFRNASEGIQWDKQGPLGSLADKNPNTAGQTSMSRVEGFLKDNHPRNIQQHATTLNSPNLTEPVNPLQVARAVGQSRLHEGSTDPGHSVRGFEDSMKQRQLEALIAAGGRRPDEVMAPLSVADRLQAYIEPAKHYEPPTMNLAQMLIRPFRTMDIGLSNRGTKQYNNEVARLLADPSAENMSRLRQIAMFSPEVRQMLTARAAFPAVMGMEEQ